MNIRIKVKEIVLSLILLLAIVSIILDAQYDLNYLKLLSFPIKNIYAPGDGRLTMAVFKLIVAESWSSLLVPFTSHLNAPFKFEIYDFPLPFFSDYLYIKFLSIFSSDSVVVFNLYYISTYFLNAFTMYWVLRRLRVNLYLAISIGILFTFLPFHFWRLPHTFYSGYFFIPIWIYYLLLLTNKKPLFFKRRVGESKYSFDWSKRNIIIIIVLLVSSTWNFYYTFFFSFLIGFTLLSNFILRNSKHHILSTLLFLSLAVAPFAGNMIPYKAYEVENGKNYQVSYRDPIEAEILGLKIATLVFPVDHHRSHTMAEFKENYSRGPLYNESNAAVLGLVGAIGFLILILVVSVQKNFSKVLVRLSQYNLVALLISTVGGFGVVIAYLVTPQIRGYNRISVFIAAMSFIALAVIFNKYLSKLRKKKLTAILFSTFILLFGIWDLSGYIVNLKPEEKYEFEYLSDQKFIQQIESQFDVDNEKIMIAQYPYLFIPEGAHLNKMGNYEQLQGYIHSDKLYWSFGAMKGRMADTWWQSLMMKPLEEQIQILQHAGFSGIMINRNGYQDHAENIESRLIRLLESKPMVSDNEILSFYRLSPTGSEVLMPEIVFNSFYDWEGEPGKFRWAGKDAQIILYNNTDAVETKNISFVLGTLRDRDMEIELNNRILEDFELKSGSKSNHSYKLIIKPGRNILKFETKEPSVKPSGADNRRLSFSLGELMYD